MALTKATTYNTVALPNAYYRAVYPQIDFSKTTMSFRVWVYPSQVQADTAGAPALDDLAETHSGVPYSLSGANPLEQAYAYLKTLPAYASATNVLEAGQIA